MEKTAHTFPPSSGPWDCLPQRQSADFRPDTGDQVRRESPGEEGKVKGMLSYMVPFFTDGMEFCGNNLTVSIGKRLVKHITVHSLNALGCDNHRVQVQALPVLIWKNPQKYSHIKIFQYLQDVLKKGAEHVNRMLPLVVKEEHK